MSASALRYQPREDRNGELRAKILETTQILVAAGIAPERLTAVGYGRSRPRMPNITEKNRQINRRVEFVILQRAGDSK